MKPALCALLVSLGLTLVARANVPARDLADRILAESGVAGGLAVHVGALDNGALAMCLRKGDAWVVQALVADSARAQTARQAIVAAGLHGPVSVIESDLRFLPYTDHLVSLLILEADAALDRSEIQRILAPLGVCLRIDASGIVAGSKWTKPWPADMDHWSHWNHAADGNPVSADRLVGIPRQVQWLDGPGFSKQHWGPRQSAIVSDRGRLFIVEEDTPTSVFGIASRWKLVARDAFSGIVLWEQVLPEWAADSWGTSARPQAELAQRLTLGALATGKAQGNRDGMETLAAGGGMLFLAKSPTAPVSAIDPATGKVLRTYDAITSVGQVLYHEGVLVVCGEKQAAAFDAASGKTLWTTPAIAAAAKGDRAYVIDGQQLACLDLRTGGPQWKCDVLAAAQAATRPTTQPAGKLGGPIRIGAGIALVEINPGRTATTAAVALDSGKFLWARAFGGFHFQRGSESLFIKNRLCSLDSVSGELVYWDPITGQRQDALPVPAIRHVGHHARCYRARATESFILAKERGMDLVSLTTGDVSWNDWVRGPCQRGIIPANGLLYAGPHSCRCYTDVAIRGLYALAPERPTPSAPAVPRLLKGPAFGDALAGPPAADAWPTYRHDTARSGATSAAMPAAFDTLWSTRIGGRLTAPVAAAGRVYLAGIDDYTLYAIDAATGDIAWRFAAAGRIDSPPTIHGQAVLFGSNDGHVYCLRAKDGALTWRLRGVEAQRSVTAHGRVESAWPISGSILVRTEPSGKPTAYFVAGRSSFLDGGMEIAGVDVATGDLRHSRRLLGPFPDKNVGSAADTPNRGYVIPGAAPDVLVADDQFIYLRQLRFDPTLKDMKDMEIAFMPTSDVPKAGESTGGDIKFYDDFPGLPKSAVRNQAEFLHHGFFYNFPGLRLYTTAGILDGSWHRRMFWSYGQVVGQYLVFSGSTGYAVQPFAANSREGGVNAGEGYVVYAGVSGQPNPGERLTALKHDQARWRIRVSFRPNAMALAGDRLLLCGTPDLTDPKAALDAIEGRKGGLLRVVGAADGKTLHEATLPWAPAYDAIALAAGRAFITTQDGRVVCLGRATPQ